MTEDKRFKRLVRDRAAATGESYAAARRQLLRKRDGVSSTGVDAGPRPGHTAVTIDRVLPGHAGFPDEVLVPAAAVGLTDGNGRHLFVVASKEEGDTIESALAAAGARDTTAPRLVDVVLTLDVPTAAYSADVTVEWDDGDRRTHTLPGPAALVLAASGSPSIFAPTHLLSTVPRPRIGSTICPECGADGFDTVMVGPASKRPAKPLPDWITYEVDAAATDVRTEYVCWNGHRFRDGIPRRPWLQRAR